MILQVGVKAFLRNNEGKYLLLYRSAIKYPEVGGQWDLPGGRINIGSLLVDNLKREVLEETGLEISSDPVLLAAQDIIMGDEKHVVRLTYFAAATGKVMLDITENTEYKWVTFKEILTHPEIDRFAKEIITKGYLNQFEV